jgi:hypothetical protein
MGTGVVRPAQSARLQSLWDRGHFDGPAAAPAGRIAQMHRHRALRPLHEPREDW